MSFLAYIENIEFYGNGCGYPNLYSQWIGEYPWASSCQNIESYFSDSSWLRNSPLEVIEPICRLENSNSDACPRLPGSIIFDKMKLLWTGQDFDYINQNGEQVAFSRKYKKKESWPLFVKRDEFLNAFEEAGLIPFWATLSERSCYSYKSSCSIVKKRAITQRVYSHENNNLICKQDKKYEIPLYK